MEKSKSACSVVALVSLAIFLVTGSAKAVTVKVETSSGASTSATYYTQGGDRATGDASVSSIGGVSLNTAGSVEKGLVRAESGAGDRAFTPYTGDFSANATAGAGGASSSATFSNPRVDIFVASDPMTRTIANLDPGAIYGTIGAAVAAAGGEVGVGPDWILVDQGTYNERVVMDDAVADFEDNSALTCAWCGGDTIIDGTGTSTNLVDVDEIDGFRMEGFTVTNAEEVGIAIGQSNGAQIICNSVTDSGYDGINVRNSTGAEIRNNIVTTSGFGGISVISSNNAQVRDNNVTDSGQPGISAINSASAQITNNTVTDITSTGIMVLGGNNVRIGHNTVTDTTTQGIWVSGSPNAQVTGNSLTTAGTRGIDVSAGPGTQITGNAVTDSGQEGIYVSGSPDGQIMNNIVTGNNRNTPQAQPSGAIMVTNGSLRAQITNNTVTDNGHNGIWVGNGSNAAVIDDNIVANNDLDGITVYSALGADITNNNIANNQRNGIALVFSSNSAEIRNNTVADNEWDGIQVRNSNGAQITSNIITGNGQNSPDQGGIRLFGAATVATTAAINENNIEGNVDFGLWNDTPGAVNATNNWWGAADGPSPLGSGDRVRSDPGNGTPIVTPWATAPFPLP